MSIKKSPASFTVVPLTGTYLFCSVLCFSSFTVMCLSVVSLYVLSRDFGELPECVAWFDFFFFLASFRKFLGRSLQILLLPHYFPPLVRFLLIWDPFVASCMSLKLTFLFSVLRDELFPADLSSSSPVISSAVSCCCQTHVFGSFYFLFIFIFKKF